MFSVIIPASNQFEPLQKLLGDLTPAAVDGLIREVLIADADSQDPTAVFCEDAGVDLIQGGLIATARAARSDWLVILPVTFRADSGRLKALKDFSGGPLTHARYAGARPAGLFARPALGLIVRKADVVATDETREPTVLLKRLSQSARRTI